MSDIPENLPPLNLEQVRQKLVALLSDAADLGAYIDRIDDDGTVVVKNFDLPPVTPGCPTLPKTTRIGTGVPAARIDRALLAVVSANTDFAAGAALRIRLSGDQPACVGPGG